MTRMFSFITETWNPLAGECPHRCVYCWARRLSKRLDMKKYQGDFRLIEKELRRQFKSGEFVFVCDMIDLFASDVPIKHVKRILEHIGKFPETTFLLQTKNPRGYYPFLAFNDIPENAILGVTVESNRSWFDTPSKIKDYSDISIAPQPIIRLAFLKRIRDTFPHRRIFLSVEPILDFNLETFVTTIKIIKPWGVAIGYDNYGCKLPEPPLEKTLKLISKLEDIGIKVYRKTLRKAWYEKEA